MKQAVAVAAVLLAASGAVADEPEPTDDYAAAEIARAPRPGQESGRADDGEHDSTMRKVGRGVLSVPRFVLETLFAPVRGGLWLYDKYTGGGRVGGVAFNASGSYGVYPMLYINSDFGATVGARFEHTNLFGEREKLVTRIVFGGEFNEAVSGRFMTGNRFTNLAIELSGEFERRPNEPFYGIGNTNDVIEVEHRQQLARTTTTLDLEARDSLHVRFAGALTSLSYGRANDGPAIDLVYGESMLTGWNDARNLYVEVEMRWDTRRVAYDLAHHGVLLDVYAGRVLQLGALNNYMRYGGDAIYFLPLGIGRSIATRVHLEGVTGSLDDVAFTQLPELGGAVLLRGYPAERFRDRVAALGTLEYFWDLSHFMLASLFVDVGRVYPSLADFTLHDLRVGYGASFQLLRDRNFVAGLSIATSIDGGVFANLVFDPVYEPLPRVRRR
jgi:hypothetical protein